MSFFDACSCCGRPDGLTSGGCLYCLAVRTYCICGQLLACGCGRTLTTHACPCVVSVGTFEAIPTLPLAEVG